MDSAVSKHEKHNQKSHAGKKRVAPSAGGKVPKSSGSKKQVDASTKKVVDLITQEAGAETAKRLEPAIRESFKQFYSGDINKPLIVNGKKVTNQGRNLTAKDMLDSIANQFGTEAVTGISDADFASGDAFRRVVKANSDSGNVLLVPKISKADPTSTDVHVPTIMNNQKKRKRRTKKMMVSEVVEKKERLKDPKGGLTAAGRAHFKRTEGANLKPGVRGKADTPEKMRRKGSFLTRFFTNPSGPMKDEKGRPTRLALSAAAWGEPVPSDRAAAARLAAKGRRLLERYDNLKKDEELEKFNPNHDSLGRFTSGSGRTVSRPKALRARGGKRGIYQGLKGRAMTELTRTGEKVGSRGKTKGYIFNPKTGKTTPHGFD